MANSALDTPARRPASEVRLVTSSLRGNSGCASGRLPGVRLGDEQRLHVDLTQLFDVGRSAERLDDMTLLVPHRQRLVLRPAVSSLGHVEEPVVGPERATRMPLPQDQTGTALLRARSQSRLAARRGISRRRTSCSGTDPCSSRIGRVIRPHCRAA